MGDAVCDTEMKAVFETDGDVVDERETDTVWVADLDCDADAERDGDGDIEWLIRMDPDTVVVMEPERDADTVTEFVAVVDDDDDCVTDGVVVRDSDGDAVDEKVVVGDGNSGRDREGDVDDDVDGVVLTLEKDRDGDVDTVGDRDERSDTEVVLVVVAERELTAVAEKTDAVGDTELERSMEGDCFDVDVFDGACVTLVEPHDEGDSETPAVSVARDVDVREAATLDETDGVDVPD